MKSILIMLILGLALLVSGDRQSEAFGVRKTSPGVFAIDGETFTVTIEHAAYVFKVKNDRLILQDGCDLYSAKMPGNISSFNIRGKDRLGVLKRSERNLP